MDTITLRLKKEQAGDIDFLAEIPTTLQSISEHNYGNGLVICGRLSNMRITVTENNVKIENSLCKYYLGNNLQEMRRSDIERAIQKLSDELHLPVGNASVLRFDFAKNISLSAEVSSYLNYLGNIGRYMRYPSKRGINYRIADKEIAIYDKIAQLKHSREFVPPFYQGKNIMRIEKRHLVNTAKHFNRSVITASNLFDEVFYIEAQKDWERDYNSISKLQNSIIDMSGITTKKQLYILGVRALIEQQGGETAALLQIQERQKKGELTKKQALDLRNAYKESNEYSVVTKDNELIAELNQKVKDSLRYYR